ncbi:cytochrome c biogenesis heme-transporting ATPase CcmA [Colwellia sp. PAMC 21821]|uniref:cytochrome c biogenesis heme-transporting ATPase CcmA n=1 Tax=Colwellia sp. PAMC 21821 TaxID=1816219 RepID=UPI0009BF5BC2|nr:cytochrome c biogenesis heme-transporting ATPase CcmA [Colwellia sp. PAMC 21821]ARD46539.1 heme ABC exporter ATP-binding protein CcmA [Colwellia sp. PAMC 21821]
MTPSNTKNLLSANNLTCIREDRVLFEALNLSICAGEILQIEGPNGAGKTSLLRILAGLSQPYDGGVSFKNKNITQYREMFHQDLLYLGHLPGVKDEMTAQENLEFNLTLHGLDRKTAEITLAEVNLLGFEDALASHLSAGQHRRIALARLWQSQAKIWILDEPFTAIDKLGVEKLEQLFMQHADNGGCVILTTHQDLSLPAERVKKVTLAYRFY